MNGVPLSPKEILATIDDSIAKLEEALKQYDAQIASVVAQDDNQSDAARATLMEYRPIITEELEKLRVVRRQEVLKAEKWTGSGK